MINKRQVTVYKVCSILIKRIKSTWQIIVRLLQSEMQFLEVIFNLEIYKQLQKLRLLFIKLR
jgi:hypothetical protein